MLAAVVTSTASIVVAVTSACLAYATQRRMQGEKAKQDRQLAELNGRLTDLAAERTARRSYEYDARKRLYAVTEPLLFQLSERAEELQASISGLARTARNGELNPGRNRLSTDPYYLQLIVHRLLAPVALFRLLQDGLTQVDLNLDPNTRAQYLISKYLAWALTDDYVFAAYEPVIRYDPSAVGTGSGKRVPRQGQPSGIIDTAGDSLIIRPEGGTARVVRFGEFAEAYANQNSKLYKACTPVAELLYDFHPGTHAVLWRIMIMQAHLCAACIATRDLSGAPEKQPGNPASHPWLSIPPSRRNDYDWRQPGDMTGESGSMDKPFDVARKYLEERLHPDK